MIKKCELKEITLKTDIQQKKKRDKGMEITLIKKKNADNYSVFNIAGIRKK